jgi:hypothetical protein
METKPVKVLIVAETAAGFWCVSRHLEQRGCKCWFAHSYSEGALLFEEHAFDLVLCSDCREGIRALITSVIGSSASLFRSHSVEDSCWWLPAVLHGDKCLGMPALRPSEFAKILDRMMEEIRSTDGGARALTAN